MMDSQTEIPFIKKQRVTMEISADAVKYFRDQASVSGIPYQTLINQYLIYCAKKKKKISLDWNWLYKHC